MITRIPSRDVPQADCLKDVIRLVEAVGMGASTYQEMAAAIRKVGRQGRYYRRAAEILGFTRKEGRNRTVLTPKGRMLVSTTGTERHGIVRAAVVGTEMFKRVIPYLAARGADGVSRNELRIFIESISAPVGPTMVPRRVSSVIDW